MLYTARALLDIIAALAFVAFCICLGLAF